MTIGVLMTRNMITQKESFTVLPRASQYLDRKLRDAAAQVVETGLAPDWRKPPSRVTEARHAGRPDIGCTPRACAAREDLIVRRYDVSLVLHGDHVGRKRDAARAVAAGVSTPPA